MNISCTDPSCHYWFPDFLLVKQNASPQLIQWTVKINQFWQLGSVHKAHIHLEATSPLRFFSPFFLNIFLIYVLRKHFCTQCQKYFLFSIVILNFYILRAKVNYVYSSRSSHFLLKFNKIFVYSAVDYLVHSKSKGSHTKKYVFFFIVWPLRRGGGEG